MKCVYHNNNEAEFMCPSCGQPVCRECMTAVNGKNICKTCAQKMMQYNNIPQYSGPQPMSYKKRSEYSGFLFFIFLAVPGLRHMYMGLMKRGLQFLSSFFGSIMLMIFLEDLAPIIAPVLMIIWFYSAFDSYQLRKLKDRDEVVKDEPLFADLKFDWIQEFISKRKSAAGIVIIIVGFYMLLRRIVRYNWAYPVPEIVFRIINIMSDSIVPLVLIAGGIYLLSRAAKGKNVEISPAEE